MHLLVCADAFKEGADASAVCSAMARGVRLVYPGATVDECPLADGGEGTARILTQALGGEWTALSVSDPLGRPVTAGYGWLSHDNLALIDMAEASGLQHLETGERNALQATSFGTGQLIRYALERGARTIYLGLGGSATTDAGMGMAAALGIRSFSEGRLIEYPAGEHLPRIDQIDPTDMHPLLAKASFRILCDVRNPLFGAQGAAHVYAPQKGATKREIDLLDRGLQHINQIWTMAFGRDVSRHPGAGAAGGLGAASLLFLRGELVSGAETVLDLVKIDERMARAQLILTGEGSLDEQSLHGKLIERLAIRARQQQTPIIALCGRLLLTPRQLQASGLLAAFPIQPGPLSLVEALRYTTDNLEQTAARVAATFFGRKA